MTGSNEDLASELAYVRSLAEEGRDAPLIGGRYYVIWGGLMGLAGLVSYLHEIGVLGAGLLGGALPWLAAGAAGWALSFTLGPSSARKPGAMTLGNKTAMSAWLGVGVFMTVFFGTALFLYAGAAPADSRPHYIFLLMFPVAFGLYGVAFMATATASRLAWLNIFSALSWTFSVICLFLAGSVHQLLAGAVGTFICAALPGVLLMRAEPRDIV